MVVPIFQDALFLGGEHDGYARVPFEKYLELNRVRRASEDGPNIFRCSSIERLAKLQCWLNFALLEAVTEEKIRESKLLKVNSSGEQVLTSEYLPDLLMNFRNLIRKRQGDDIANIPDACRKWARRILDMFVYIDETLYCDLGKGEISLTNISSFLLAGLKPQVLADIFIQMMSMFQAVGCSCVAFHPEVRPFGGYGARFMMDLVPYQHRTNMFARGWCPMIIDTIPKEWAACLVGYAGTLESPRSRSSEGHGKCTPESCVVSTRDSSNDPPKHFPESCKCSNSMPSLEDVKRLLQERKIPVVDYGLSVKDSSDTPFVAISHVWADGLRGTTEKGLPRCQIERIVKMTRRILKKRKRDARGGAFWIDTLCIPEIDDMRHRAIGLMAQTYREAEAVLVIDSGIQDISSSAPLEEKLVHVLSSRWMQRLWTFQEAVLAKKVYYQFSDGPVSLDELLKKIHSLTGKDFVNPVLMDILIAFERAHLGHRGDLQFNFQVKPGFDFNDVLYILRKRTASKRSDEMLAVCGVLNLDGFELARISDPDQRMETFLLRIGKLPSNIIFSPDLSRLEKPGFRWAPKMLMGNYVTIWRNQLDALCTSSGLESEYDAVTHGVAIGGENRECYISHSCEGSKSTYKVAHAYPNSASTPSCNTLLLISDSPQKNGFDVGECAGVWVDFPSTDGGSGGGRIVCEFRTLLDLKRVIGTELREVEKFHTVKAVECVRKRVKVV